MTHLRQIMLEELRRRNYAESTIRLTQALSPQRQTRKRSRPAHPDTNPIVPGAASFKSLYLKRPLTAHQSDRSSLSWALQIQH